VGDNAREIIYNADRLVSYMDANDIEITSRSRRRVAADPLPLMAARTS
jgi:hypothetical protein